MPRFRRRSSRPRRSYGRRSYSRRRRSFRPRRRGAVLRRRIGFRM